MDKDMKNVLNIGFIIIRVWWGHQIMRWLSLKTQFATHRSQKKGGYHPMQGNLGKHQDPPGGREDGKRYKQEQWDFNSKGMAWREEQA